MGPTLGGSHIVTFFWPVSAVAHVPDSRGGGSGGWSGLNVNPPPPHSCDIILP